MDKALERWRAKRQDWMVLSVIRSKDIMLTDISCALQCRLYVYLAP